MLGKHTTVLLAALGTTVTASFLAEFVPQVFDERDVRPAGGWSLALNSEESCPSTAPACGSSWCCPSALSCVTTGSADIGEACCPGTIDCISAFQVTPYCADDSWSLWNSTSDTADAKGYFCCLPGQSGLQDGSCVPSDEVSSPTQLAVEIAPGSTGTISASVASSSSSAPVSSSSSGTAKSASTTASSTASSTSVGTTAATKGSGSTSTAGTTTGSSSSSSASATATKASSGERNFQTFSAAVLVQVLAAVFAVAIL